MEIETGGLAVLEETRRLKTVLVKAESVLLAKNLNNYTPFTLASTPNQSLTLTNKWWYKFFAFVFCLFLFLNLPRAAKSIP